MLTAAELSKWLSEIPGNWVVAVSDTGDYIYLSNPDNIHMGGVSIYIGPRDE